jgi:hypothetical protein
LKFGSLVAQMLVARGQFGVGGMRLAGQRSLDPLPLAAKELACSDVIHFAAHSRGWPFR